MTLNVRLVVALSCLSCALFPLKKDPTLKENMRLLSAAGYLVFLSSLFTHGAFESANQYESVKDSHSHASLEVRPDSKQHLSGQKFTLRCSVNTGNSTGWILRRQGAKGSSGCLQLNGTESTDRPEECHFIDIDSKNSGLYWCENIAENKTSNSINITVVYGTVILLMSTLHPVMKENSTDDSDDEKPYTERNCMSVQMRHLEGKGSNRKCLKPSRT
ncbi:uncharacterized protein LOC120474481 isoform X3 [Pimephales promelas]|uniref:uncharacterized protein LOC120474481 isoform X3 n=1 Tax=Pimephales promelas TaxID=90988 RepID=UPI001955714D|nr:uncharacterized protein LOC120474481 isoform X3 [Pimephales promelas]